MSVLIVKSWVYLILINVHSIYLLFYGFMLMWFLLIVLLFYAYMVFGISFTNFPSNNMCNSYCLSLQANTEYCFMVLCLSGFYLLFYCFMLIWFLVSLFINFPSNNMCNSCCLTLQAYTGKYMEEKWMYLITLAKKTFTMHVHCDFAGIYWEIHGRKVNVLNYLR